VKPDPHAARAVPVHAIRPLVTRSRYRPSMHQLPDLATATRDVARWELEFALDPGASAANYAMVLNTLAIRQIADSMPDAAVASWIRAAEVAAHPAVSGCKDATEQESCVNSNLIPHLLEQGQGELALDYAERLIVLEDGEFGTASGRGLALESKARCLRRLGRSHEELSALVEAMGLFALTEDTAAVPRFSELMTDEAARRIAEIFETQPPDGAQ